MAQNLNTCASVHDIQEHHIKHTQQQKINNDYIAASERNIFTDCMVQTALAGINSISMEGCFAKMSRKK